MYQVCKKIDAHVHLSSLLFMQDLLNAKPNPLDGNAVKACLGLMDRYGIDQCVTNTAQGISIYPLENHLQIKLAEMLPERIAGVLVGFSQPKKEAWLYDSAAAAAEIAEYLRNPVVKGLGEFALQSVGYMADWPVIWDRLRPVFDVLAKHKALALFHTGAAPHFAMGSPDGARPIARRALYYSNPVFIDDIAEEYPEVPIIIGHAGVQGFFYYGSYADMALTIAARHSNVYIETSSTPYEVLLKAVSDPAIGPEKLIFGTDTPAFYSHYKAPNGEYYPSYGKSGPGDIVPDHYKYELENIARLPITDVQKQMILGGTIARLMAGKE